METREIVYDMIGTPSQVVAAPNAHAGPFYGEAMGGATIVGTVRGVEMTLGAQWQSAALLWFNDVLAFDIDKLLRSRYVLGVEDLDAFTEIYFGMASALNTGDLAAPLNLDAVAAHAHFRADGTAATLYAESDDGTTDVDDVATGETMLADPLQGESYIDFVAGVQTLVPPPSAGAKANVLFHTANAQAKLRPVCATQRFNMSQYAAGLQPFVLIQRDATGSSGLGTFTTPTVIVRQIECSLRIDT